MKDEEIKALMNKYTEAISYNTLEGIHSPEDDEEFKRYENMEMADYVALKRKEAHKIAIEVLDKILTPELKVFVMNLCLDRLGYPDDPSFYKIFGVHPKVGTKVRMDSIESKDIDWIPYNEGLWNHEGNFVKEEEINGQKHYVIECLNETREDANQKLEILELSRILSKIKEKTTIEPLSQDEWKLIDEIEKKTPLISGLHI